MGGGLGPVLKISPDLRLLATYTHADNDPRSLPDEGITGFAEDRFGRIWMGSDNGLACLDQKTGKFQAFTSRQGLPHDDISAVLMVGDTLWLSTSRGVACMDSVGFGLRSSTKRTDLRLRGLSLVPWFATQPDGFILVPCAAWYILNRTSFD